MGWEGLWWGYDMVGSGMLGGAVGGAMVMMVGWEGLWAGLSHGGRG